MTPSNEELAYIAGLIDGEGTIFIAERHPTNARIPNFLVHVAVKMTQPDGIEVINRFFPVGFYRYERQNGWSPIYHYALDGKKAEDFLEKLLPYLRVKLPQAMLALKLREIPKLKGGAGCHTPKSVLEARKALTDAISRLNRKEGAVSFNLL